MAAPEINGTVRLSSGGREANSTNAATAAPTNRPQWYSMTPVAANTPTTANDTARNAAVPPGDFPHILGPGMGRPTKAAAGSPRDRNNNDATAMVESKSQKTARAATSR